MQQINISETAENDLYNAALYISENLKNNAAAILFLDVAAEKISSLTDFPERNALVRDSFLAANGIRMQLINKYLAFYVIREETKSVTILRILHSRRNWISILTNEMNKQ